MNSTTHSHSPHWLVISFGSIQLCWCTTSSLIVSVFSEVYYTGLFQLRVQDITIILFVQYRSAQQEWTLGFNEDSIGLSIDQMIINALIEWHFWLLLTSNVYWFLKSSLSSVWLKIFIQPISLTQFWQEAVGWKKFVIKDTLCKRKIPVGR